MPEPRTIPHTSWANRLDAWRAAAGRRKRRRVLLILCGCAAIGIPALLKPVPRLVWNASPSVPVGLYAVAPGQALHRGDLVTVWLPEGARRLAAIRRYLPETVPLLKRVVALPPDRVCALPRAISVNGAVVAQRVPHDRHGRALPWWTGCRTLSHGDVFLLGAGRPDSFDGRYFGTVARGAILGTARPLWLR